MNRTKTIFIIMFFLFCQTITAQSNCRALCVSTWNYPGTSDDISINNKNDTIKVEQFNVAKKDDEVSLRNGYFYLTIGIIEPIGLGFGYQIDSIWAVGLKFGGYWLSGGLFVPNAGSGIGIKICQNTKWKILNNINYELTFFYRASDQSGESKAIVKGIAVDLNIGNENINNNGINFLWSMGIVGSSAQGSSLLILPNLKIGFNINF